ncbi:hypothetical protein EVAR_73718_1 [Eumeta japonica]|uniref:Uncharacterized protein n=1 Tax=Eumeta variegata TaxID=151549 RepID=A0A4C1T724_EUMVA|nr:hypothetical protein EVAR_73718_1 [Eumeta japonica]
MLSSTSPGVFDWMLSEQWLLRYFLNLSQWIRFTTFIRVKGNSYLCGMRIYTIVKEWAEDKSSEASTSTYSLEMFFLTLKSITSAIFCQLDGQYVGSHLDEPTSAMIPDLRLIDHLGQGGRSNMFVPDLTRTELPFRACKERKTDINWLRFKSTSNHYSESIQPRTPGDVELEHGNFTSMMSQAVEYGATYQQPSFNWNFSVQISNAYLVRNYEANPEPLYRENPKTAEQNFTFNYSAPWYVKT